MDRLESGFDDLQEGIEVEGIVPGRVVKIVVAQPAHAPADTAPTFDGDPTAFRMDRTRRFALAAFLARELPAHRRSERRRKAITL